MTAEAADDGARAAADRIAALLDEVHATAEPPTWLRVEELVQRLVGLYGKGLERLLDLVADAGALDDRLASLLGEDELVSSLLVLHGLHPASTAARIRIALDRARPELASHGVEIELVDVGADGVARLRFAGARHGCGSSRAAIERAIEAAVQAAAPEVARVEVEGAGVEKLVQIDLRRSRAARREEAP